VASFIGVDGGASRSVGLLTDDETVLARCAVGPTNPHVVGETGCLDALRDLFETLRQRAPLETVQSIWLGISGVRSAADFALVRRVCETLGIADRTTVSDDLVLALASANAEKCGIAVVAGTGSCVYGVNIAGDTCTAGGRGHLLGDEGSAYAIAVEALRAASQCDQERGPETSLLPRIMERLGVSGFEEAVRWTYSASKADIASLAPLVFDVARHSDEVAKTIVERGGRRLAESAHDVALKLGLADSAPTTVLYGGLFEQSEHYFDLVRSEIVRRMPTARVVRPPVEGAVAAARLARERGAVREQRPDAQRSSISVPLTETSNWRSAQIDRLSTKGMLEIINTEDRKAAHAVEQVLDDVARAVDAAAEAISSGGRVFYIGAGTSGRLGVLDAAECPPTFGVPPEMFQAILAGGSAAAAAAVEGAEDDIQAGAEEIARREIGPNDLVVGISSSGTTPFVKSALDEVRRRGAGTALVACNPATADFPSVDILITPIVGPEIIAGSTRMKAGTATKMVLNMISTGAMIKLGKVYGNLMIDVQPRSSKLVNRARRILQELTGIDDQEAAQLMKQSGNDLKVAIIMRKLSVSSDEAVAILAASNGNLRDALKTQRR